MKRKKRGYEVICISWHHHKLRIGELTNKSVPIGSVFHMFILNARLSYHVSLTASPSIIMAQVLGYVKDIALHQ